MTVEQQAVWGAPAAQPPTWSTRTTLLAAAIAAVLAVGAGTVVYATWDPGADHAYNSAPPGFGGPGGPGGPGEFERTVHAESVVSDGKGGFRTELTQTGSITAASDASITVRSVDGYRHTYVVGTDTRRPRQPLQSGQEVTVRAIESSGASDATAVLPAR